MSRYILINRITVQNANAVAGFTWGFPAITHFLGFTHNLARKLTKSESPYNDIQMNGCAVICHKHHVHCYRSTTGDYEFTQSRNPPYLFAIENGKKGATPPIIEEGKMNMTISLLISYEGNLGHRQDEFILWLRRNCFLQRLAGGTILEISGIYVFGDENHNLRILKKKLLPGFVLMDRSRFLKEHFEKLELTQPDIELLDAWLDFSALKYKARPKSELIDKYLHNLAKTYDGTESEAYLESWLKHIEKPYDQKSIPDNLKIFFKQIIPDNLNKELLLQWENYCSPTEKTDADWEYVPKPQPGYLVPIMTGYKAISPLYDNNEVTNTRDDETDVCFVESVHSVGEWLSVHRFKSMDQLSDSIWRYHYEVDKQASNAESEKGGWYLCKQQKPSIGELSAETIYENPEDDFC